MLLNSADIAMLCINISMLVKGFDFCQYLKIDCNTKTTPGWVALSNTDGSRVLCKDEAVV